MTYKQACEFFHYHGNVGRTPDELMTSRPAMWQLGDAARYAVVVKGQPEDLADEAKAAIEKHWDSAGDGHGWGQKGPDA
jgi:uncharacterized protein YchJ